MAQRGAGPAISMILVFALYQGSLRAVIGCISRLCYCWS